MPTDVANQLGTARQFIPKPDATYQGRYQDLQATTVRANTKTANMELGQNLQKLSVALNDYRLNTEKYKEQKGLIEATRMINSETPEDVAKLNLIDAAQSYGYVDSMDNPYFQAHAERLRGGYLSAQMKQEYDDKYAMSPAKSANEEQSRYAQFSSDYKKKLYDSSGAPQNSLAFEMGYNESNLINANKLSQDWYSKKHAEDLQVTNDTLNARLGVIVDNSGELLKENGLMTKAVQDIANEAKLMGLPPDARQSLWEGFLKQLVANGRIDGERLEQMCQNIDIQTNVDGTQMKLSDVVNIAQYKQIANDYHNQFMNQRKYDFVKKYTDMGRAGIQQAMADVEDMRYTDPVSYAELAPLLPQVVSGVERKEAERARALKTSHSNRFNTDDPVEIANVLDEWLKGNTVVNGMPITSWKLDEQTLMDISSAYMAEACKSGDASTFFKIMQLPQMRNLRQSITAGLQSSLAGIKPTDDGGTTADGDMGLRNLALFVANNPNDTQLCFGSEVAREGRILASFMRLRGEAGGLRLYSEVAAMPDDIRRERKQEVDGWMAGLTIEGARHLNSFNVPEDSDTDTIYLDMNINGEVRADVEQAATAYALSGMTSQNATIQAINDVKANYVTYHWGAFPRSTFYNMGTNDDQGWLCHGLDALIYECSESQASEVQLSYNSTTQTFTAINPYDDNRVTWSLAKVRKASIEAYQRALEWSQSQPTETSSYSADDINRERGYGQKQSFLDAFRDPMFALQYGEKEEI